MSKKNCKIFLENIKWSLTHEEPDVDFICATITFALEELDSEKDVHPIFNAIQNV